MHLISWIIMGIVAGFLARRVIPGEGPLGVAGDLIVGGTAALAGGWLFQTFFVPSSGGWIGSMLVGFIVAFVALFVQRVAAGRRTV
jgi:uncharacterized membrane protein YeaQ/YmgE (transglycosylase-associated protein family)